MPAPIPSASVSVLMKIWFIPFRNFIKIVRVELTLILLLISTCISSQEDTERPEPPILTLTSINQSTGNTELRWELSPSPDVAKYVVHSFVNNEAGFPIDTIDDPEATSYSFYWPWSFVRTESFVVEAIDSSDNLSPLSNELQTIFADISIDTCKGRILTDWNQYIPYPYRILGYDVLISIDGSDYEMAAQVEENETSYIIENFIINSQYCVIVNARLENGLISSSNHACIDARMKKPPLWINADYATVSESDKIELSFTYDPESEIDLFALERKTAGSVNFIEIARIKTNTGSLTYIDNEADLNKINFYRLSAVNNCNIPVITSNTASNIVLNLTRSDNEIALTWNKYKNWLGTVSSYRLYSDKGNGYNEISVIQPGDSVYGISIPDIMYDITADKTCFYISAEEKSSNPYGITGVSNSNKTCFSIEEIITVPNIFSPDGDLINDLFRPVLTFTPTDYHLVITDRQRKILFETRDHNETWDGSNKGNPVSNGVFIWFLNVIAPSGKNMSGTGTLTIIRHR